MNRGNKSSECWQEEWTLARRCWSSLIVSTLSKGVTEHTHIDDLFQYYNSFLTDFDRRCLASGMDMQKFEFEFVSNGKSGQIGDNNERALFLLLL